MAVKDTLFCLLSSSSKAGCESTAEGHKKKQMHVSTVHLHQGLPTLHFCNTMRIWSLYNEMRRTRLNQSDLKCPFGQTYLRLPLFAAEAACPVTEASDAVFDGVFLVLCSQLPVMFLVSILVQIFTYGVGFGPATGQGV